MWRRSVSDSHSTMTSSDQETDSGRREPLAYRMMPVTLADFSASATFWRKGKCCGG